MKFPAGIAAGSAAVSTANGAFVDGCVAVSVNVGVIVANTDGVSVPTGVIAGDGVSTGMTVGSVVGLLNIPLIVATILGAEKNSTARIPRMINGKTGVLTN